MATRKLRNAGRRQAVFGAEAAAILAAAGINAATQLTAAGINSSATKQAASEQAKAINTSAARQAQAVKDQTQRSKEYQQESQEFIKEQNAENRELQRDIQMQLQMLTGQQNVNDRLEASKIKVRNGGCTRRKLRNAGMLQALLRGSDNMPFTVTDGGGVIALGQTPEGYDLYEIYGNDHEHYHKAQGGKNKTGVGIKFADGNVIEGEGNQNGSKGEKMLVTPTNAYFLSRHSIKGFNPAKSVDNGMNPLVAYALQEQIKAANGISDDGEYTSPVKRIAGGMLPDAYILNIQNGPHLGVDIIGDTTVGVAYATQDKKEEKAKYGKSHRCLRNGGRAKAYWGGNPYLYGSGAEFVGNWWGGSTNNNTTVINNNSGNGTKTSRSKWTWNNTADLLGAGISGLGNLGGAWITSRGNLAASKTLAGAYNNAANIMADAYRSLSTIDMDSIRKEDYTAAHAMPALQAPVSFAGQQIAGVDRQLQRRLENAGRYSASSAAAQRRMSLAEVDAQDMRNRVYSSDQEQMQQIRQQNAQRVSEAAMRNAELDTQANQQYASAYLNLLQYNNDIENQKILGAAGALSEGATNGAGAIANAQTANAAAWSQAMLNSSQGFANSLANMSVRRADLAKVMLGATGDSQASYYANPQLSSTDEAKAKYDELYAQWEAVKNSTKEGDKDTAAMLKRRINTIASARGFKMITA